MKLRFKSWDVYKVYMINSLCWSVLFKAEIIALGKK